MDAEMGNLIYAMHQQQLDMMRRMNQIQTQKTTMMEQIGQTQAFRTDMTDNVQLIQATQTSFIGCVRHMRVSQNTMAGNVKQIKTSQITMVDQTQQWQTFQNSMEHYHQKMLEHLYFSQPVEDHCNNQLDSLSARLSSLQVLIERGHGHNGYGRGRHDGRGGWNKAKAKVVANINTFTDFIQFFSFSHFYLNIEDNFWFMCGGGNLLLSFYCYLVIFFVFF